MHQPRMGGGACLGARQGWLSLLPTAVHTCRIPNQVRVEPATESSNWSCNYVMLYGGGGDSGVIEPVSSGGSSQLATEQE